MPARKNPGYKASPYYELEELCDRLGSGETLMQLAMERGVSAVALWKWMNKPENKDAYREALQARGMMHALQTEQYVRDMFERRIDAKTADVAIKASQWMASRLTPELFGDRRSTEITVNDEQTKHLAALKAKAQKRLEEQQKHLEEQKKLEGGRDSEEEIEDRES